MSPKRLADELRRRAHEEGFDAVAIARAAPLGRDGVALGAWLDRGFEAGMRWMARDPALRADPRGLLDDCASVVVVAMNYFREKDAENDASRPGRVARYARGRDYHKVMGRRLSRLTEWLEQASGVPARRFVDTGPVLERAWAERSGIGWIGKNANLLTRDLGSWLLLGEILSAAPLEPDPGPHEEMCGSCTACLDDCPTGAIVEPGVVDANRCISYWTIEHRGPVPRERRAGSADWLFGCDVCQDVCPWNKSFSRPATGGLFEPRAELDALDPVELLGMDEGAFRERYSGTPLMRAKWEGMRRNACIVIGNLGREADREPLEAALSDDGDPVVRGHAAWALASIGGLRARKALEEAARRERDPGVLEEIADAIARLTGGTGADGRSVLT